MNITYILVAFFGMLGLMLLGLPIAVSMAAVGIVGGLLAYGAPFINTANARLIATGIRTTSC